MRLTQRKTLTVLLSAAVFAAPSLALADARVLVGHFAPFADTLDGTSVSVRINGQTALEDVRFGDFTSYIALPAGAYTLEVLPTGSSTVAISASVTLMDNTDYTVLAVGNGSTQPLSLQPLVDNNAAPASGDLKLRVVHAAPFADSAGATAVSIRTDAGAIVGGLSSVPFFAASGYLEIPAGNYDLKVATPDGSTNLIDLAPVDLPAGAVLTVLATGDGINQPLGFSAIPLGALPTERPVDASVSGHWSTPGVTTRGFALTPKPDGNRLIGSWYTWTAAGAQVFYGLDSSGPRSGAAASANGGFDNDSAVLTVYSYSGGTFNGNETVQATPVGTASIEFADCDTAAVSYAIDGIGNGSFDLQNLTPSGVCTLP